MSQQPVCSQQASLRVPSLATLYTYHQHHQPLPHFKSKQRPSPTSFIYISDVSELLSAPTQVLISPLHLVFRLMSASFILPWQRFSFPSPPWLSVCPYFHGSRVVHLLSVLRNKWPAGVNLLSLIRIFNCLFANP